MSAESTSVVGIDLGTTFSVVSHLDAHGRAVTIANSEGDLTTPSVVYFDPGGIVVGKEAVKSAEFEPDRVAPYPKRDMGTDFYHLPIRGNHFRPEVLQAFILRKLKSDAEAKLGPLSKCVITVPAYFNEPRRKATQDAGRMAGWDVLDIINEPTAAAIAYGVHRGFLSPTAATEKPETILVYDLGGGTFDVTLMKVEQNCFTTLATAGDVELGGIDWDQRIVDLTAERFESEHGVDPRTDVAALHRLRREAEDAKRSLSTKSESVIIFAHEGKKLRTTVTRDEFEARTGDLVDRTIMTIRKLLREAAVSYADLSRLLVVGGSSRMPMIRTALETETGFTIDQPLSVDEAVAQGAAVYARYLQEKAAGTSAGFQVRNVNSHTLGVLGIEPSTMMRRRKVMIARNTPLPAKHTQKFVTAEAKQKSVVVTVVEGGDDTGAHSTLIGRCVLAGLAPDLPPRSQVDVTFHYAEDGRLEVRAFMPSVQREASLTIERAQGLSPDLLQAWADCVAAGVTDATSFPETKAATSAPAEKPTNPMNAPDVKRVKRQVDEVQPDFAGDTAVVELEGAAPTELAEVEPDFTEFLMDKGDQPAAVESLDVPIGEEAPAPVSSLEGISFDPNKKRKKKKPTSDEAAPEKSAETPPEKGKKKGWKFW